MAGGTPARLCESGLEARHWDGVAAPQAKKMPDGGSRMERSASRRILVRGRQVWRGMSAFSTIPCQGRQVTQSRPKPPLGYPEATW
jgi:hypothetical protein